MKESVRQEHPNGVSFKHNAEYGFHRNLLGSRTVWLGVSVVSAVFCLAAWIITGSTLLLAGAVIDVLFGVWAVAWGWFFLQRFVKEAADSYADSVWNAFLVDSKKSR